MKFDSVPPVAVTSAAANVVDDSLSVKVMVAVSPLLRAALLLVIVTVGATVSIVIDGVNTLVLFVLPAASEKPPARTETEPATVEFTFGVKTAE